MLLVLLFVSGVGWLPLDLGLRPFLVYVVYSIFVFASGPRGLRGC